MSPKSLYTGAETPKRTEMLESLYNSHKESTVGFNFPTNGFTDMDETEENKPVKPSQVFVEDDGIGEIISEES